jgi:hypothetical protein
VNQSAYDVVADGLMTLAREIETSKRPGYTRGDDDVLANFKRAGQQAGITTEQAWAVLFMKHIDAILSIMTKPHLAVSEAPEGRFADAVNYLRLGFAILREGERATVVDLRQMADDIEAGSDDVVLMLEVPEVANVLATAEGYTAVPHADGGFSVPCGNGISYTITTHAKAGPK